MNDEYRKRMAGKLYDAHNPVFIEEKRQANLFLKAYNAVDYADEAKRRKLLEANLGHIGAYSTVGTPFLCDMACNIYLADKVSVNMNCSFMDSNKIIIDEETMIAPNVQIYTGTHPIQFTARLNPNWQNNKTQHFVRTRALPVHIQRGCWLGGGVIVLPGVTIGEGSVIGAGSVVTQNIPDHVVAVGNPCRVLYRIDEARD